MRYETVGEMPLTQLPGRAIRKSIGKDGGIKSDAMTFGRTCFSLQYGKMAPHCHAEEIIYVLDAAAGSCRYGSTEECADGEVMLKKDMVLHIRPMEWHVFEFTDPKGYADVLFFYAQVENLRPEEK